MSRHPDQPIIEDDKGNPRFQHNGIIRRLVDEKIVNLATVVHWASGGAPDVTRDDLDQFYQLLGYSVGGYCELVGSKVTSNKAANRAEKALANGRLK